jgi:ribosomal protein S18 acetylase RimI-like enzyme
MPDECITLEMREARAEDLGFLFALYCDVRGPEVSAWGWPAVQRDTFLRMQFEAQRWSYQAAYPEASNQIVCSGGVAIGRRLVARTMEWVHLVDIALLAAYRNQGIGTRLIQELMDDCDAQNGALSLQVMRGNPALRLYQRMGFGEIGVDPMYIQMQWIPGAGGRA